MISFVRRCHETDTKPMSLEEVFDAIKSGAHGLKERINQIRNRYEAERDITGDAEKARKAIAELKMELPGFLPSGTFTKRDNASLVEYSGLLCADIDGIGEGVEKLKESLKLFPFVHAIAISPSGDGLKVFFNVVNDPLRHFDSFRSIKESLLEGFGITVDDKCKDLARICFFTYDPDIWVRTEGNEPIPPADPISKTTYTPGKFIPDINLAFRQTAAIEVAANYGRVIEWETASEGFLRPCPNFEAHNNRNGPKDCKVFLLPNEYFNGATFYCVHQSCRDTIVAMRSELNSKIAIFELRQNREASEQRPHTSLPSHLGNGEKGEFTDLSSLSSPIGKPKMGNDAFYGLTREIVDQILPYSESDPVALLLQLLVAFGSIIDRKSHCRVGGAYHYMNMFAVLVGETARGRKGTSWNDVLHLLLKDMDIAWYENITGGLSSGEGLISAIKDPVTRERKGEIETVEAGVTDKRLLIVEGEFARVLKVMQREQNTLSAIIRTAWESGILRTLTKCPYRASKAHVSILGHITPEEIRHWMNQIEAANGFGNRILWAYVERSKDLPEGSAPPDLSEVLEPFRTAIEYASAGDGHVLTRDDEAKELWASVYSKLSEGKIGLTGALTARAEAQALRLSAIYALLDCCNKIGLKHLQAALAVWRYCEQSVYYIFKRGTGNNDADKIITALHAAGEKGMARWDIQNEVFNRHATKLQIDEALRLLVRLKFAYCKEESTGGRPSQHWWANREESE